MCWLRVKILDFALIFSPFCFLFQAWQLLSSREEALFHLNKRQPTTPPPRTPCAESRTRPSPPWWTSRCWKTFFLELFASTEAVGGGGGCHYGPHWTIWTHVFWEIQLTHGYESRRLFVHITCCSLPNKFPVVLS